MNFNPLSDSTAQLRKMWDSFGEMLKRVARNDALVMQKELGKDLHAEVAGFDHSSFEGAVQSGRGPSLR
jgi:hypothetical protein